MYLTKNIEKCCKEWCKILQCTKMSKIKYLETTKWSTTKLKNFSCLHQVIDVETSQLEFYTTFYIRGHCTVWCCIWDQHIRLALVGALCTGCSWVNHCTRTTGMWSHIHTSPFYSTVSHLRISRNKVFKDQNSSSVKWILPFLCVSSVLPVWMLLFAVQAQSTQLRPSGSLRPSGLALASYICNMKLLSYLTWLISLLTVFLGRFLHQLDDGTYWLSFATVVFPLVYSIALWECWLDKNLNFTPEDIFALKSRDIPAGSQCAAVSFFLLSYLWWPRENCLYPAARKVCHFRLQTPFNLHNVFPFCFLFYYQHAQITYIVILFHRK